MSSALMHLASRLLLACGALLASACSGAGAADDPPRLHVVRVNERSAVGLTGARRYGELMMDSCRIALQLPDGGGPGLSEAQLGKIVFFQDETFYDGDRIAHYVTVRAIVADRGSACAPYLLVQRRVEITLGCGSRIVGDSGNNPNDVPPLAPPPWKPTTQVENNRRSDGCGTRHKTLSSEGVPADVAGAGVNCVWFSRLMAANFRALSKSGPPAGGAGPSETGQDECLYQPMPEYASPHGGREHVTLRTHAIEPSAAKRSIQSAGSSGVFEFAFNTTLQSLEVGGPDAGKFDRAAAEAFLHLPPKEAL